MVLQEEGGPALEVTKGPGAEAISAGGAAVEARRLWAPVVALASVCAVAAAQPVMAADWTVEPAATLWTRYDDNFRLRPDGQSVWQTTLTPSVSLHRETDISRTRVQALANLVRYNRDEIADRHQFLLGLDSRYRGERSFGRLNGSYRRDTTLALIPEGFLETIVPLPEELELVDVEPVEVGDVTDPDLIEIGLITEQVRRERLRLRPTVGYFLTERTRVRLDYDLVDVSYDDAEAVNLREYRQHTGRVGLGHALTPLDDIFGAVSYSRYRAPDAEVRAENRSLTLNYSRQLAPTLEGTLGFGYRETENRTAGVERTSSGTTYEAALRQRAEISTLRVRVAREVNPTGAGRLVETDRLGVRWDRELVPRWSLAVLADAFRVRALEEATGAERRYYRVEPRLRYALSRWSDIEASYRYRRQKRDAAPEAAESHAVMLAFTYSWPRAVTLP
jgi:hypothetical protein